MNHLYISSHTHTALPLRGRLPLIGENQGLLRNPLRESRYETASEYGFLAAGDASSLARAKMMKDMKTVCGY